jgi:hypothetical protein
MNLTENQKSLVVSFVAALAMLIAGLLGFNLHATVAPAAVPGGVGVESLSPTRFRALRVDDTLSVGGAETHAGTATFTGPLVATSIVSQSVGFNATGATTLVTTTINAPNPLQVNGNAQITGTLNITNGLSISAVSFSGPVKFGKVTGVVTGTTIAHGLGVTPTSVLLTASGTVTTTPEVLATNTTSITVGFKPGENPDAMTVNWMAGK